MKITRLRIAGFKSFVDTTDVAIEPGLSGVVGPNGCGKSNLVEALRFVMGESSFKAMRGSGMDDVIFAGSTNRPARNAAEVSLQAIVDGAAAAHVMKPGQTPATSAELEISRRIEREAGSTYRVNGREVRARDVNILFADAATGARSSALVRQGQIGELIAAKPKDRRSILEDAAGISGLHSRRHEAELKLKGAEQNLERLEDVLGEITGQLETLKRQARQAARYRNLSFDIRKMEAQQALIRLSETDERLAKAETALNQAGLALAKAAEEQSKAAREEAVSSSSLPKLREKAAAASAAVQHLRLKSEELKREAARRETRQRELESRRKETAEDVAREEEHGREARSALATFSAEAKTLTRDKEGAVKRLAEATATAKERAEALAKAEAELSEARAELAAQAAERRQQEMRVREAEAARERLLGEARKLKAEQAELAQKAGSEGTVEAARSALEAAEKALKTAEETAQKKEQEIQRAREGEAKAREKRAEGLRALTALQAEEKTLAQLLRPATDSHFVPVVEGLKVEPGYEAALAAALGEDLDASADPQAPFSWQERGKIERAPELPSKVPPLAQFVSGEPRLVPRLSQIGVVEEEDGHALFQKLAVGQRLVSRNGALWRWDGLTIKGGAKTAAAVRLEQKNRLEALSGEVAKAEKDAEKATAALEKATEKRRHGEEAERQARQALKEARSQRDRQASALSEAERVLARQSERLASIATNLARVESDAEAQATRLEEARAALGQTKANEEAEAKAQQLAKHVEAARREASDARAAADSLRHASAARDERLSALGREITAWQGRIERAARRIEELQARQAELDAEIEKLAEEPETYAVRQREFAFEIDKADTHSKAEADRLAEAETAHRSFADAARRALDGLSKAREAKAREDERTSAIRQKREDLVAEITAHFRTPPEALRETAELKPGAPLPELAAVDQRLERLLRERERLGGVNLRAEEEAKEVEERLTTLTAERDDLTAAIKRLRQAVHSLNREGRERLLGAFDTVNRHFQELFHTLFGGGSAELMLTESDDPLDAGLEIMARPPGKKPQIMTLLSGGEQALTTMALIFAVFLTNPSPICVLDEVDAPLDDANTERFCDLLGDMRQKTETRFLVVTHNPLTMARMDRLFGITMAERGVSQLVSVDLETAERFREAG
ncbi:chromosome segregation protein SMC [Afifella sp. JA880]|uniref:chromosome segregation protein SMC n=1 Tax=Afifella sp. JA880 TaxID=2975280 RepID=UPI0021BB7762|nr:chromosome segregation protein SMC [Afifella sp. JA880]MCT8266963.1 chromosome segregation protein SMC [Afifella sp. JA880]